MSFERVGSSQTITVDVRILAATHQDLEALIRAGRFREDLYYRLNVIRLRTPSLRERKEDIFELAVHFLGRHAERIGKAVTHLDDEAVEALVAYDWPGNIRELENVIERAVVLADGPAITRDDLPAEVRQPAPPRRRARAATAAATARPRATGTAPSSWSGSADADAAGASAEEGWDAEFVAFERQRLLDALAEAHGNKSEAARLLGMPRSTLLQQAQEARPDRQRSKGQGSIRLRRPHGQQGLAEPFGDPARRIVGALPRCTGSVRRRGIAPAPISSRAQMA